MNNDQTTTKHDPLTRPLRFTPLYKEKIWGGRGLERHLCRKLPVGKAIGESWELSGYGNDQTICLSPPYAGETVASLTSRFGESLLGACRPTAEGFPLLYKMVDANDKLSVQVHPDDRLVQQRGWGAGGKTECWYIIAAQAHARIIAGVKESVTRAQIAEAARNNQLEELLLFHPIKTGDVLFIPAGAVHAILDGTMLFEVQQSCDITFRLYDWGRVDIAGKPRDLHVDKACEAISTDFHAHHIVKPVIVDDFPGAIHALRAACRFFALEEYRFNSTVCRPLPAKRSFQTITLLAGTLTLHHETAETLSLGETILLPVGAGANTTIESGSGTHLLVTSVPDLYDEIVEPLLRHGVDRVAILQLGGNPATSDLAKFITL